MEQEQKRKPKNSRLRARGQSSSVKSILHSFYTLFRLAFHSFDLTILHSFCTPITLPLHSLYILFALPFALFFTLVLNSFYFLGTLQIFMDSQNFTFNDSPLAIHPLRYLMPWNQCDSRSNNQTSLSEWT